MTPGEAKRKGRATESALVAYLRRWVPHAERRHLAGSNDRGDIAGTPGICWEVKSGAALNLSGWMLELGREVDHDQAAHGVLAIRPKGHPDPSQWWAVMSMPDLMALLVEAGWIAPTRGAASPRQLIEPTNTGGTP